MSSSTVVLLSSRMMRNRSPGRARPGSRRVVHDRNAFIPAPAAEHRGDAQDSEGEPADQKPGPGRDPVPGFGLVRGLNRPVGDRNRRNGGVRRGGHSRRRRRSRRGLARGGRSRCGARRGNLLLRRGGRPLRVRLQLLRLRARRTGRLVDGRRGRLRGCRGLWRSLGARVGRRNRRSRSQRRLVRNGRHLRSRSGLRRGRRSRRRRRGGRVVGLLSSEASGRRERGSHEKCTANRFHGSPSCNVCGPMPQSERS